MAQLISYQTKVVLFRNNSFVCDAQSHMAMRNMSIDEAISFIDINGSWVQ